MIARAALSLSLVITLAACASTRPAPIVTGGTKPGPKPPVTTPTTPTTPPVVIPQDFVARPRRLRSAPRLGHVGHGARPHRLQAPVPLLASPHARCPAQRRPLWRQGRRLAQRLRRRAARSSPDRNAGSSKPISIRRWCIGPGDAKLTSYFEPVIQASREWAPPFTEPLLKRPPDMITVDLGAFAEAYDNETLRGAPRTLNGKLNGDRIVPYPKREAITPYLGQIIGYAHPADVYNLQVQGSGRLHFSGRLGSPRAVLRAERLQVEFRPRRPAQLRPPRQPHLVQLPLLARSQSRPAEVRAQRRSLLRLLPGGNDHRLRRRPQGRRQRAADADGLHRRRSRLPSLRRCRLRRGRLCRRALPAPPRRAGHRRRHPPRPQSWRCLRRHRPRSRRLRRAHELRRPTLVHAAAEAVRARHADRLRRSSPPHG